MVNRIVTLTLALMATLGMSAQTALDETMHSSGKINVVVAVIGVILLGMFIYLFMIDRKVSRVEKQIDKK